MKKTNDKGDQNGINNVCPYHFKPIAKCAGQHHLHVYSANSAASEVFLHTPPTGQVARRTDAHTHRQIDAANKGML